MSENKIRRTVKLALIYCVLFLLTSFNQISAQTNELTYILINGKLLKNRAESEWIKGSATFLVQDLHGETNVELVINPDSGSIEIIPNPRFPVSISVDDKIHESLLVHFQYKIDEYKIGIKEKNGPGEKYIYISAKLGYEIKYNKYDVLIVPVAFKFTKKVFNIFFESNIGIRIDKRN